MRVARNSICFLFFLGIFFLSYIHRIMYLLQHLVMFVCWKDRGIWDKGPCFRCVNSGNTDGCKDESNNGLGKSISMVVYKGSTFTNGSCRIIRLFRYLKKYLKMTIVWFVILVRRLDQINMYCLIVNITQYHLVMNMIDLLEWSAIFEQSDEWRRKVNNFRRIMNPKERLLTSKKQ